MVINKNISVTTEYAQQYSGHGDKTLINGLLGSLDYTDQEWLGFQETDFEAVVDLKEIIEIKRVECNFMIAEGAWIFSPEKVEFF